MKLSSNKQRRIGVVLSYLSVVLSTVLSLVYTPILLDRLGQEEYGVYTLVASVVNYLQLLSLGFGSAYVRFYTRYATSKDKEGEKRLNGMYFLLYCIMGALALIIGGGMLFYTDALFKGLTPSEVALANKLLVVLVINTAISFPLSVFDAIVTAHEKFVFQKVLIITQRILRPVSILLLLLCGFRSIAIVVVSLILTIVTGLISMYYVFFHIKAKFSFKKMNFSLLKEMGGYSFFIFIVMIADQVSWNLDKFLLGIYQSSVQIAIYGVAAQLNSYFLTFSDVVANVFVPKVHKTIEEDNGDNTRIQALFTNVGRIQFYIAMLIFYGFVFFGEQFIILWAGAEYLEAYYIGIVLMATVLFPLTLALSGEIMRAKGHNKKYSYIVSFGTILNIIFSIPLCMYLGAMGAAIGTAASMFISSWILRVVFLEKKAGLDMKPFLKQIGRLLLGTLPILPIGFLLKWYFPAGNFLLLAGGIAVYAIVFFVCSWLLNFNAAEKQMITNPLEKLRKRK